LNHHKPSQPAGLHIALIVADDAQGSGVLMSHMVPSLARSLAAFGHGVHVICPEVDPSQTSGVYEELRGGLTVRRLVLADGHPAPSAQALWRQALGHAHLAHTFASKGLANPTASPDWTTSLAPLVPVVLSMLDMPAGDDAAWQAGLDAAALVLVPSRTLLVRLADRFRLDANRTRIQEPGLFHGYPQGLSRARSWNGEGPLRILHLGPRTPESGIEELIAALDRLPQDRVQLCCFGPRGPEGRAGDLARMSHRVPMAMAGRLESGALARVASTCHVAALPGMDPGAYPFALEEALALGLPVMACESGSALERYGAGPIQILPPGDVEAWAVAFLGHLENPSGLQCAQAAVPDRIPCAQSAAESLAELYRHALLA